METPFHIKKRAVEEYLEGRDVSKIAERYKIHPKTLKRWVKKFREGGAEALERKNSVRRPWNRFPPQLERKIALMKERNPQLTLNDAKKILEKKGIKISLKGIWSIWKRYGLAGYEKEKMFIDIRAPVPTPLEIIKSIHKIENLLKSGQKDEVYEIVNNLPHFPLFASLGENRPAYNLLSKLVFDKLSERRKLDWLYPLFGEIPHTEYRDKARELRREMKRKRYRYSAIIAGILEVIALGWTGEIHNQLLLIKKLKKGLGRLKAPHLRWILYLSEGLAYSKRLEIEKAMKCVRMLKKILPHLPCEYMGDLVPLLSSLSKFKEARVIAEKSMRICGNSGRREILMVYLSYIYAANGECIRALQMLRKIDIASHGLHSRILLIKARASLYQGNIRRAMELALKALEEAKKEEIKNHFHNASFLMACAYRALNYTSEASKFLETSLPSIIKMGSLKDFYLWNILLNRKEPPTFAEKHPAIKLAKLLKNASATGKLFNYRIALRYAKKYQLLGLFNQLCLFFPETVKRCLQKGGNPGLPAAFLKLPVFAGVFPVYHVDLLGSLRVLKNGELIRGKLTPKQGSLLLFIVLYPQNRIPVDKLYKNFWANSKNPSRNLSRALTSIRKFLKIHPNYLKRRKYHLEINIYFTTDYQYFLDHITRARVFEITGEIHLAKIEYKKALSLIRRKPFEKMYDTFAEDTRTHIVSLLNTVNSKLKSI